MSAPRITELSSRIALNTSKLNEYFVAHNLPTPSFDVDGPLDFPSANDPNIDSIRFSIVDDTLELRRLVLGPKLHLMSFSVNEILCQQVIIRYRLAHAFPVGGEATFTEIANISGLSEADTRQILRRAILLGIFAEPHPGVVAHTATSRLLAEDEVFHDWVGANVDDLGPASAHVCEAMEKWPSSEEPTQTGFALANNTDKSIYGFFSDHPERAERFANAMRALGSRDDLESHHTVNSFPWGELGDGIVVDVGGSQGTVVTAIARKYPSLSFIVQDLEPVVESGRKNIPSDVAERVQFMAHDFLTPQPVKNADVYYLRWILHNWPDKYCIIILQNLIPALKPGARIVVNDNVLPTPGGMSNWKETRLRSTDLTMKAIQNSHERELDDWKKLFAMVDPKLELLGAEQPSGSSLWMMVLQWKGD